MNLPVSILGVAPSQDASLECVELLNPHTESGVDGQKLKTFHRIDLDPKAPFSLSAMRAGVRQGVGLEWTNNAWCARAWNKSARLSVNNLDVFEAPLKEGDYLETEHGRFRFLGGRKATDQQVLRSKNTKFAEELGHLMRFAQTDFPVLITGPSGSGKELLARQVHDASARSIRPYVALNCSALSESLIESELFGHIKGAFTGAQGHRLGAFEAARGGTLFLDEIGDLPLSLQPKLLRALENSEIRAVGSDRSIKTDVRIIAATHKNLGRAVRDGRFREDLYWRLQVCSIAAPALKDRPEDITDLVYHFCRKYRVSLSLAALEVLRKHSWPGNVRELKNVMCRASALGRGRQVEAHEIESCLTRTLSLETQSDPHPIIAEALSKRLRSLEQSTRTPGSAAQVSVAKPDRSLDSACKTSNSAVGTLPDGSIAPASSSSGTSALESGGASPAATGAESVRAFTAVNDTASGVAPASALGSASSAATDFPLEDQNVNFKTNNLIVQIERDLIIRRLQANNGNQRKTALELGIPKSTLHDRIYAYNITCARRKERRSVSLNSEI